MIALEEPEAVLDRLWQEVRTAPELADLLALLPADARDIGLGDAVRLLTLVVTTPVLKGSERQLDVFDALGHAWARARGLRLMEE